MKFSTRVVFYAWILLLSVAGLRAADLRPMIAVAPKYDAEKNQVYVPTGYLEAVEKAGGLPVILPLTDDERLIDEAAGRFDGFLFPGGPDIAPAFYGQTTDPVCEAICDRRDALETKLMRKVLEGDKPVFAVCRGCQLLNVSLGGSLYQDIPTQLDSPTKTVHRGTPSAPALHTVSVVVGTPLHDLVQTDELTVNSVHHQGVRALAPALKVAARAPDGLVEAVYLPGKRFVLGVQWHPDTLWKTDPKSRKLFEAFVERCREGRRSTGQPDTVPSR